MRSFGTSSGRSARERVSGAMTTRCVSFRFPIEIGVNSLDTNCLYKYGRKPLKAGLRIKADQIDMHPALEADDANRIGFTRGDNRLTENKLSDRRFRNAHLLVSVERVLKEASLRRLAALALTQRVPNLTPWNNLACSCGGARQ